VLLGGGLRAAALSGTCSQLAPSPADGGTAGYTAILIAQQLAEDARLVSIEKELSWVLVAKRFLWQASQGDKNAGGGKTPGQKVPTPHSLPVALCKDASVAVVVGWQRVTGL
jgi:hypothetical protein